MYDGIKKATGPTIKKTAPLKTKSGEVITDSNKQMERWVEHYLELYSTENTITDQALDIIKTLPVMTELDTEPTEDDLSKAIDSLKNGKAPGKDAIPPEVIKHGKHALLHHLHVLLLLCWKEGTVPQDMRDANIVTLYKNKGDRSDCNNYRGISLLSVVGKVFARVALTKLQILAERTLPESQCGFRTGRSTIDMIFSVRQLQEKCREQRRPLFIAFIDLTKAFDLVSRRGLFNLLEKIGCPPKLLSVISSFHNNMKGTVNYDGATSEPFDIHSGVKQGCVLAPTLFTIFFSMMLSYAFNTSTEGVFLHTRADGKLFNLARLRAKTKVRHVVIREMLFADDAVLVTHTIEDLQQLIDRLSHACKEFGLTISIKKTKVMGQGIVSPPSIMTQMTKLCVYQACVLSTLLYSSEAWTTYTRQEKKLNSFHLRCLRRILDISWRDKITNTEVLEHASSFSMYTLLSQRRLRWLGHVHRMANGRIPKDMLYGELVTGTRTVGRSYLRYRDTCKRDMKVARIDTTTWEAAADDRGHWRAVVKAGMRRGEENRSVHEAVKREKRKQKSSHPAHPPPPNAAETVMLEWG